MAKKLDKKGALSDVDLNDVVEAIKRIIKIFTDLAK